MLDNMDKKVITEVYEVIKHLNEEQKSKIPEKLLNMLKENRLNDYKVNIDDNKEIYNQDISEDAMCFVYQIFRVYMASNEEKAYISKVIDKK